MNRRNFIGKTAALVGVAALGTVGVTAFAADGSKLETKSGGTKMKIVVLQGSPRLKGNTNHLSERFAAGAREAGHEVTLFSCARAKIRPCFGCNKCGMNGDCVQRDDYAELLPQLLAADMIVLCSPMYYFGFSAQIKTVIDRFYSRSGALTGNKKTALLMACGTTNLQMVEPMLAHYKALAQYMKWQDVGRVVASGMVPAGAVNGTKYADAAYELGKRA